MDSEQSVPSRPTTVRNPTSLLVVVWTVFPLIGAGIGWVVHALSAWTSTVDGLPFQDWVSVIAKIKEPYGTVGCMLAGAIFVGSCVRFVLRRNVAISVSTDRVIWKVDKTVRRFGRDEISAIYLDGIDGLAFLGPDTAELARASCNLDSDEVKRVFLAYRYPFFDADPHLDEFVRWVEDMPDLDPAVNALMKAREKALKENESDGAAELRADLGKLGVIVRQNDSRQFYRLIEDESDLAEADDSDEDSEDADSENADFADDSEEVEVAEDSKDDEEDERVGVRVPT